jgi:phage-related protein
MRSQKRARSHESNLINVAWETLRQTERRFRELTENASQHGASTRGLWMKNRATNSNVLVCRDGSSARGQQKSEVKEKSEQ